MDNQNFNDDYSKYQALFNSIPQSGLKCDILFLVVKNRIKEEPEYVKRLRVLFQFNITKNNKLAAIWSCDTKKSLEGEVYRTKPRNNQKPDCELTIEDDDCVQIMLGKLNPQRAFMLSKIKIKGNILLMQKLHSLWCDLRRKGKTPELDVIKNIMASDSLIPGLKSEAMMIEIVQRILKSSHLYSSSAIHLQVEITRDEKLKTKYYISMQPNKLPILCRLYNYQSDLMSTTPEQQNLPKADVTILVDDDSFVLIVYRILSIEKAIERGKLRIEGAATSMERVVELFNQPTILSQL